MDSRKTRKLLLSAVLALVMMCSLVLASCTQSGDTDTTDTSETTDSQSTAQVTVTFMVNDAVYKTVSVENNAFGMPKDPEVEGFAFKGWFTSKDFTTAFDGKDVKESLTVYAKLEAVELPPVVVKNKVLFLDAEGAWVDYDTIKSDASVVKLPAPPEAPRNQAFVGWFTDEACKTRFNPAEVTDDVVVYAHMVKVQFEVKFLIRDNGEGDWINHRVIVTGKDGVIAKMPVDPAVRGFDFKGWFTDEACTKAFDPLTKFEKDGVIVYAKLTEKQTGEEKNDYYALVDGGEYILKLMDRREVIFNADKEFTGTYNISGSGLTIILDASETINAAYKNGVTTFTYKGKDVTCYVDAQYEVRFDSQEGSAVPSVTVRNGSFMKQPENPTRHNYHFAGWFTDAACEHPFSFAEDRVLGSMTLYAGWKKQAQTITYVTDDNVITVNKSTSVFSEESFVLEVPTITDSNRQFAGWFTEDGTMLTDAKGKSLKVWNETMGNIKVVAHTEMKLNYELLPDGNYKASGTKATQTLDVIEIPAMHEGKPVTEVGRFDGYDRARTVIIPATVTSIDTMAFVECKAIEKFQVTPVEGVESKYTASADGVLFRDGETTLAFFPIASAITSYTVPATVTKIGDNAFRDFVVESTPYSLTAVGKLESVVLPKDLDTIGAYAFYARRNLTGLTFAKDAVTGLRIEEGAFKWCCAQNVDMPQNLKYVGKQAFLGHSFTVHFGFAGCGGYMGGDMTLPEGLEYIGDEGFKLCSFATVRIPNSVTFIGNKALQKSGFMGGTILFVDPAKSQLKVLGEGAFYKAANTSVVLPAGLEVIEGGAFEESNIQTLEIPEGTLTIKDGAFRNMSSLNKITIPASVKTFGQNVFAGCPALKTTGITFAAGSTIAKSGADGVIYSADGKEILVFNRDLTSYNIPEGVEILPSQVFKDLTTLTQVTLPSTLKDIGSEAFVNCGVTELTIPASVEIIGNNAFFIDYGKTQALRKLTFAPKAVNGLIIENHVFEGLKGVTIVLPEGTSSIGLEAFMGCDFQNIVLPDSITSIGAGAFKNCAQLVTVTLPASLSNLPADAFDQCGKLANYVISDTAQNYRTVNGVLYNSDKTTLVAYPLGKTDTSFTIPDTVITIGKNAFARNRTLTTIVFTKNIREIGESAFTDTNLTEVDLTSVNTIGKHAFALCRALKTVKIGPSLFDIPDGAFSSSGVTVIEGIEHIKTIGDFAFRGTDLTGVLDLSNVETIGKYAFGQVKITGVTFGDKLVKLGEGSFYDTEISSITLPGSLKIFTGKIFEDVDTNVLVNNYKDKVLKEIILSEGIIQIDAHAFFDLTALERVVIPASVKSIDANAFYNANSIREFVVAEGNKIYKAVNGSLYTVKGELVKYAGAGTELVLGADVTGVNPHALEDGIVTEWDTNPDHVLKKFTTVTVDSQSIVDKAVLGAKGLASVVADGGSIRFKDGLDLSKVESELLKTFDKTTAGGYTVFTVKAAPQA